MHAEVTNGQKKQDREYYPRSRFIQESRMHRILVIVWGYFESVIRCVELKSPDTIR